ncbi:MULTISPECIES: SOS response-associated peptidase [Aerococcus]|uniref:Abasic site processing protein n=1 Tax=Aerococcus urinae TaxID=1376 RepID=A0A329NUD5_9LACT|nr:MULTISPECIES: SOS response-associated peptidase family protein [Aerococcus]MDK6729291.1 SOS response-associated peptidase family protein [Aerococcus urinae]RAV77302.1 SOS response-associated peptidase [Aerococcus loyolae]
MCGRYEFNQEEALLKHFYQRANDPDIQTGTLYPGQVVLTLSANPDQSVHARGMEWGYAGFNKGQLLINARSKSITDKATFQADFHYRRCLFPMSSYYEWTKNKERYRFSSNDILYVGGCYQMPKSRSNHPRAVLMTQSANPLAQEVHHRMPYFVQAKDIRSWLNDYDFARHYQNSNAQLFMEKETDNKNFRNMTLNLKD